MQLQTDTEAYDDEAPGASSRKDQHGIGLRCVRRWGYKLVEGTATLQEEGIILVSHLRK